MSMDDLPVVAIIDRNGERRGEMAGAFEGLARVQIAYPPSWGKREGKAPPKVVIETAEGTQLTGMGPALLALRHIRDKLLVADVAAQLTVYYGGNGGYDADCPPGAERIWRRVLEGVGTLTRDEARGLLAYAAAKEEGAEDATPPPLLVEPPSYEILPALSILCQGFLAVFAEQDAKPLSGYSEELRSAFDLMGWSEAIRESPVLSPTRRKIADGREHVTRAGWWLKVFGLLDGRSNVSKAKSAWFMNELGGEWRKTGGGDLPDEVRDFFRLISTRRWLELNEENARLVAQVYRLVTYTLGGNELTATYRPSDL